MKASPSYKVDPADKMYATKGPFEEGPDTKFVILVTTRVFNKTSQYLGLI